MRQILLALLFFSLAIIQNSSAADSADFSSVTQEKSPSARGALSLGREVRRGVIADAWLDPVERPSVSTSLSPDDNLATHRIRIIFTIEKTGETVLDGQTAARIYTGTGQATDTVRLEGENEVWSGFLHLPDTQETMIKVGTKLTDGKKRIYRFFYQPSSAR